LRAFAQHQRQSDPSRRADGCELTDGRKLAYDKLLLTTGARVRRLKCPGADLAGVNYLKTIADVDGLQEAFRAGARIANCLRRLYRAGSGGGGRQARLGCDGVRGDGPRLMARSGWSPDLSAFYGRRASEKAGVNLRGCAPGWKRSKATAKFERIIAGGQSYDADLVLVGDWCGAV